MKSIAIIGAGLTGLRAGLELGQGSFLVHIWEKSPSVGGRLATRRFEDKFVNHGAPQFNNYERVLATDPMAKKYAHHFSFKDQATKLAKEMKEDYLKPSYTDISFGERVLKVKGSSLHLEDSVFHYDHVLITSPLDQTRELLESPLSAKAEYSKKILFIGVTDGEPQRIELSDDASEKYFELSDEEIRSHAEKEIAQSLSGLQIKKWRYCQVKKGVSAPFVSFSSNITLAGDAFDSLGEFNMASAWLSGMHAALFIKQKLESRKL